MPLPSNFDEPRADDRPPSYYRGNAFGGVPHTRIRVWSFSSSNPVWGWLNPGVVIQSVREVDDPAAQFQCNAQWNGYFENGYGIWRVFYEFNQVALPANSPVQISITNTDLGGTTFWRASVGPGTPVSSQRGLLKFSDPIGQAPIIALATNVKEWSKPSDYWQGVIIAEESP